MSTISIGGKSCGVGMARVAADWLGLAAAPAFATMALMTGAFGSSVVKKGITPRSGAGGSR